MLLSVACAPVQQLQSAAATGTTLFNSVTGTGELATLGATELRQLQSRDYATTKSGAFAGVMTVLLDSGYRVLSADLTSGLVTAAAPTTSRLRLDPLGVARSSQTPMASVFIEERGADAIRVRITFTVGRSASGQLGAEGERAVLDAELYAAFFGRLDQEVSQRPVPAVPSTTREVIGENAEKAADEPAEPANDPAGDQDVAPEPPEA